jgi:catechol 2,3-dioxygenase-like lactoylglutathione lyase family enzyme
VSGSDDTEGRGFKVRALGEIAIRCRDMDAMERFYSDVIGLEKLADRGGRITFFRIADGHAGHTSVLALFAPDASVPPDGPATGPGSSLHHIALSLGWDEQEAAMAWYDRIDQPYRIEDFDWIGWRGVFTSDPEGNTVELVAARPGGMA